ncbi:MAG: hypothetical protein ACPGEF_05615, partial [Endozoicomonas sp.]
MVQKEIDHVESLLTSNGKVIIENDGSTDWKSQFEFYKNRKSNISLPPHSLSGSQSQSAQVLTPQEMKDLKAQLQNRSATTDPHTTDSHAALKNENENPKVQSSTKVSSTGSSDQGGELPLIRLHRPSVKSETPDAESMPINTSASSKTPSIADKSLTRDTAGNATSAAKPKIVSKMADMLSNDVDDNQTLPSVIAKEESSVKPQKESVPARVMSNPTYSKPSMLSEVDTTTSPVPTSTGSASHNHIFSSFTGNPVSSSVSTAPAASKISDAYVSELSASGNNQPSGSGKLPNTLVHNEAVPAPGTRPRTQESRTSVAPQIDENQTVSERVKKRQFTVPTHTSEESTSFKRIEPKKNAQSYGYQRHNYLPKGKGVPDLIDGAKNSIGEKAAQEAKGVFERLIEDGQEEKVYEALELLRENPQIAKQFFQTARNWQDKRKGVDLDANYFQASLSGIQEILTDNNRLRSIPVSAFLLAGFIEARLADSKILEQMQGTYQKSDQNYRRGKFLKRMGGFLSKEAKFLEVSSAKSKDEKNKQATLNARVLYRGMKLV